MLCSQSLFYKRSGPQPGHPRRIFFFEQTQFTNMAGAKMKLARVEELLGLFSSKRVLVIGDLMLDEYVWGRVSRISPEAPVPVVEVIRESYYPGGAANVARNVREFTPTVFVMGLVGEDSHAQKLRTLLDENRIALDGLQNDPSF